AIARTAARRCMETSKKETRGYQRATMCERFHRRVAAGKRQFLAPGSMTDPLSAVDARESGRMLSRGCGGVARGHRRNDDCSTQEHEPSEPAAGTASDHAKVVCAATSAVDALVGPGAPEGVRVVSAGDPRSDAGRRARRGRSRRGA